jgi:hypothetical protein
MEGLAAMTITGGPDILDRLLLDRPTFHEGGKTRWDALPGTLTGLRRLVAPGMTTIETGSGASTVIFAANGASHTAISPNALEHQAVQNYCRSISVDCNEVRFIDGFSERVLPTLLGDGRTLDVVFIDGAHSYPYPAIDWYYLSRSLKIGGSLLLDDIPIPSVAQVFRHMIVEPNWRLADIFDDRAALFTLIDEPTPEDWKLQLSNHGYPDLSFLPVHRRAAQDLRRRTRSIGRNTVGRVPALRRAYRRASQDSSSALMNK